MDCFLIEGRKTCFRLSLAIFKLHENQILSLTDPVTIFMMVKEISKHIFNMDEVFQVIILIIAKAEYLIYTRSCQHYIGKLEISLCSLTIDYM